MTRRRFWAALAGAPAAAQTGPATTTWVLTPVCPVCRTPGDWPGTPLTLADADGVYRAAIFTHTRIFVCASCGTLYNVMAAEAAAPAG
ncbi:MAG TPA: hypothetical protein VFA33_07675 [Bryobacteraceae bacterium]|nr:hypothetical protein [Bryobacteraceae bacterium]